MNNQDGHWAYVYTVLIDVVRYEYVTVSCEDSPPTGHTTTAVHYSRYYSFFLRGMAEREEENQHRCREEFGSREAVVLQGNIYSNQSPKMDPKNHIFLNFC